MTTATTPAFDRKRLPPGVEPPTGADPERIGGYSVVGRVGAGGMGAVYAGLDAGGGCAAVKVVHAHFAADPDFRARFAREVEMVRRVRAACAPAFLDADTRADTPWLATEYVPGLTLRQHVRRHGPLSGGVLLALAVGLAEALTAIHAAGVVHRDLKPGNVILAPSGPKVLDFGIARAVEGTALTRTGGLFGTPGWVAPEQYEGRAASDRSDMFAWAGLVAFAATGRDPFGRESAEVVSHRVRNGEPDLDGVPPELLDPVRRAFDKDPGRRPTAAEVVAGLTSGWNATRVQPLQGDPVTEVVPGLLATEWRGVEAPAPRRVRRSGRPLLAAAAAVLVAALVGTWLVVRPQDGQETADGGTADGGTAAGGDAGTGEGAADGGEPAVLTDPEDTEAVVDEAVGLALGASSFAAYSTSRDAETGMGYPVNHSYTEDPEPRYLQVSYQGPATYRTLEIGEGPDDVLARTDSNLVGVVEGSYYRPAPEELEDEPRAAWTSTVESLRVVLGEGSQVSYQGESAPPVTDYPEDMAEGMDLAGRVGHHYTGSYPAEPDERVEGRTGDREVTFDLWIGDDGYPQHFQAYDSWEGEGIHGTHMDGESTIIGFFQFNGPVEIEVPDESEIAASREEAAPQTGTG
ncbi:serine/threonine protein kinase [Nocardiopsis dassonvillei]|uniref:serine/threonine-protein kinase n=1 Tax=Nocardiopsis dassonvillei TaxID=2014 RepID=UPI00102B612F|nr:serine/threonine-protein kinase [Nocardiopsis dassonvillei]MCP3014319.1 serine/threonine protein kinase [Nocardiopsis dassonvillei]